MYGDDTRLWSEAQLLTARRILWQARQIVHDDRVEVIVLATALAESTCLCLASRKVISSLSSTYRQGVSEGDHLSVGSFQQQPWWGPDDDLMSPFGACKRFLKGGDDGSPGLLAVPGWQHLDPGDAASAVQRNAGGGGVYREHLADARALRGLV
jgi:hypothetical protein